MAFFGTTSGNAILDCYFNQTNITAPTAIYASLHTGAVGNTGANEASGSSYARVVCTSNFPAASSKSTSNDVAISYAAFTGAFTFTDAGVWTASTNGTWIGGGALSASKSVTSGDTASFATSNFTVSIT
ncbi:MAG TPA: hypothetical protein VEC37_10905 [Bacillota bacterium]|nr:hypothetical protein [Bacillota bacterium]